MTGTLQSSCLDKAFIFFSNVRNSELIQRDLKAFSDISALSILWCYIGIPQAE